MSLISLAQSNAQCTTLNQTATLTSPNCAPNITPCTVCPGNIITLSGSGTNLPAGGCIDWYYGTTNNFNPYNGGGTFMGCSPISGPTAIPCATCPTILSIFVDACGVEEDNEFMFLLSGSGLTVDQLMIDYDAANNGNPENADIVSGGCGWQLPSPATIASLQTVCPSANVIPAGPGTVIPAGQPVIVFTSSDFSYAYNWASLCPLSPSIYVMQSNCARSVGAFSNGTSSGTRATTISLSCGCSNTLTYNTASLSGGDGAFVIPPLLPFLPAIYGNVGCGLPPVTFPPPPPPTSNNFTFSFPIPASMCNGGPYYAVGIPDPLPAICTDVFTNYLPFNVPCPTPVLNTDQICSGSGPFNLNTLLVAPMVGTWSGPNVTGSNFNPSGLSGNQSFTFTPSGACGLPASTTVTVDPAPTATIAPAGPVCSGDDVSLSLSFTGQSPWTFDLLRNGTLVNTYTVISSPATISVPVTTNAAFTITNLGDGNCINGTANSITVQVSTPANGDLLAGGPTSVCNNQSATLQVNFTGGAAPYTFVYSINGVPQPAITTNNDPYSFSVSPNGNTTYQLESVESGGCPGIASGAVQITTGAGVTGVLTNGSSTICQGQSIGLNYTFTGTPPFTFIPSVNGLSQAPVTANTTTFTQTINPPIGVTAYGLVSVSSAGCTATGSGFYDVSVVSPPTATLSGDVTSCTAGGSVALDIDFTGTGPFTFTYTANGVPQNPITAGALNYQWNVSPTITTTYQLFSVTNGACTGTVSGTGMVTVNNNPLSGSVTGGGQVCPGGPADTVLFNFMGDGPYTFTYTANGVAQPAITTNNNPYQLFVSPSIGTNYALQSLTNGVCSGTVSGSVWVLVFTPPTAELIGGGNFCGSANTQIEVNLTGTAPFNIGYTINNILQPIISTDDDPYILTINTSGTQTFALDTVYSTACPGTVDPDPVTVNVFPLLAYSNLSVNCNVAQGTYTISAQLSGTPPYNITSGMGSVTGNVFTSNTRLLSNPNYSFTLNDSQNCGPITISGTANCNCATQAGTMQQLLLTDCTTDQITATQNGDQVLEPGDALVYILHNNPAYPFGTIYAQSNTPTFGFQAGMMVGTTYYISAMAGNAILSGVDTLDQCLSVALGTPVRWVNPPTANLSGTYTICAGESQALNVNLTGSPLYTLSYEVNGAASSVSTGNASSYTLNTNVSSSTTYTLTAVSDQYCVGTATGAATITVQPALTNTLSTVNCNASNGTFTVSFSLTGTAPYSILTSNGTVSGNQFTSAALLLTNPNYQFQITDLNRCDTIVVSGLANCNCTTNAGTMAQAMLTDCTTDQITATHNGDQTLEADDAFEFILHTNSAYPFGTIFARSTTPTFSFQPGMLVGTTYYISAIAGNMTPQGNVDTTDQCLSVAIGTPVSWVNPPTATLGGTYYVCPGENQPISVALTGNPQFSLTYAVNGTPIPVQTNNASNYNISTNLQQDGVYSLISISDRYCVGVVSGTANVDVHASPVISNLDINCSTDFQFYTVEFDVNHDSLSSVTISGSVGGAYDTLTGHFVSAPIPISNNWNAIVNDLVWLCGQDSVGGNPPNCACVTDAGNMAIMTLNLCSTTQAQVPLATGFVLEPDDSLVYVLSTSLGPPAWTILGVNTVPQFSFNPGLMNPGQPYYILALAGNSSPMGVDLGDPCLSIASGNVVTWKEPITGFLSGNTQICQGDTAELVLSFQGEAPFTYTYLANSIVQGPFTSATNQDTLSVAPSLSVNYSPGTLQGASLCPGVFSGGGAVSVLLPPNLINQEVVCDPVTQTYRVSFLITNGNAPNLPYALSGSAGVLTDTSFVSNQIAWGSPYSITVTDQGGCSITIAATPSCSCAADAGSLTTGPISTCTTELVFVQSAGDFNIPADNILQYAIVTDTAAFPAGIITISDIPQFLYQSGMVTGQTYYIVAMVGDTLANGDINLADPCLSRSNAVPLVFRPQPTANISGNAQVCPGGAAALSVNLTGTAPFQFTYTINGGTPFTIPASSNTFPVNSNNILQNQTFTLVSVSDANCIGTVSGAGTIGVITPPEASLVANQTAVCAGQDVTLTLVLSGATNFDLNITDGTQNYPFTQIQNGESFTVTPQPGGSTYTITTVTASGNTCTPVIDAPISVDITTLQVTSVSSDYSGFGVRCFEGEDGFVTVSVQNGTQPITYLWSNGETGSELLDVPAGNFELTITDALGCADTLEFNLTQPEPIDAEFSIQNPLCFNGTDGEITLDTISGGTGDLTFQFENDPIVDLVAGQAYTVFNLGTGDYSVVITDANGCTISPVLELLSSEPILLDLGPDQTIPLGDSIQIRPDVIGDISSFQWSPTTSLVDSTKLDPIAFPRVTTTYTLVISNDVGCTIADTLVINVKFEKGFDVPNVIKPESQNNGELFLYGGRLVTKFEEFRIFDRWGDMLVYIEELPTDGSIPAWDGRTKNKEVNPGVYAYIVKVTYNNGTTEYVSGDITVVR